MNEQTLSPTLHTTPDHSVGPFPPVLLLHIPKTAGTSFLLMLQNAFGDKRVRRIHRVDKRIKQTINEIVEQELGSLSCLAGHLPLYLFKDHLHKFKPFTVLREPVARILSLYRFFRQADASELQLLGLKPGFSIEEMLESKRPGVYGQVNNGMVRMLAGEHTVDDPSRPEFWELGHNVPALEKALTNLETLDFGLTDDMPGTLALARASWSVPYALREYRENTTTDNAVAEKSTIIHRIIGMNTLDIALYHNSQSMFRARRHGVPAAQPVNTSSVFAPIRDTPYTLDEIPGRQGFYHFEAKGMTWLHPNQPAEICFLPPCDNLRLRLHIYCVVPGYPARDIAVSLNGRPLQHSITPTDEKWLWLETVRTNVSEGINQLAITMPTTVKISELNPFSQDHRQLGIAVASVILAS